MAIKIPSLPDGTHKEVGSYDNAGRWYPMNGIEMNVRAPSRSYPYSYLKHYYTRVFSKRLLLSNPELWFSLQKIDIDSEEAKPYVALVAAYRIKVEKY